MLRPAACCRGECEAHMSRWLSLLLPGQRRQSAGSGAPEGWEWLRHSTADDTRPRGPRRPTGAGLRSSPLRACGVRARH